MGQIYVESNVSIFLAGGDIYTRRYDEIIKDAECKVKCIDDALLYDYSIKDAFYHTWGFLELCALNGTVINDKKFQFCKETVIFAGLKITPSGIAPLDNILSIIRDFPTPKQVPGPGLVWSVKLHGPIH